MKVYFVVGEASGDALGAPLLAELRRRDPDIEAVGLAGDRMQALGMRSLFDIEVTSVMGIGPVVARLPEIVRCVWRTVADVEREAPDVLVAIDSPDFTHAVARRVRRRLPRLPIVNYVCPSVWAWRSGRARAMRDYVDHVLALLPFEPAVLKKLRGPAATYVGHPLAHLAEQDPEPTDGSQRLLVLPGSRRSEHDRLLPIFERSLAILADRGAGFHAVMPVPARFESAVRSRVGGWRTSVDVVTSQPEGASFIGARAALAASGTVSLELALRSVPMVLAYRTDPGMRAISRMVTTWSAALPNLIADRVVVPENIDAFAKPERLARQVQDLLEEGPARNAQLAGLEAVRAAVRTERPASVAAADVVVDLARGQRALTST